MAASEALKIKRGPRDIATSGFEPVHKDQIRGPEDCARQTMWHVVRVKVSKSEQWESSRLMTKDTLRTYSLHHAQHVATRNAIFFCLHWPWSKAPSRTSMQRPCLLERFLPGPRMPCDSNCT